MFKKIGQKEKLSEKIYNQLEAAIRKKEIKPGEKIPTEMEMCKLFDVSRTAVREAIQKLDAKGLITIRKGSGIYVNEYKSIIATNSMNLFLELNLNKNYIMHVMEMRKLLEPSIAGKAALNRTEINIQNLKHNISELELLNDSNFEKEGELDEKFHHEIAIAAGNPVALLMLEPIFQLMPKIRSVVYKDVKIAKDKALEFHKMLLKAIIEKNKIAAFDIMVEHLLIAEDHSKEIIKTIG